MARKVVSEAELLAWMNRELHTDDDCRDCEFTSVIKLAELDDAGCNWSSTNFQGHGVPVAVYQRAADSIVQRGKDAFNVE